MEEAEPDEPEEKAAVDQLTFDQAQMYKLLMKSSRVHRAVLEDMAEERGELPQQKAPEEMTESDHMAARFQKMEQAQLQIMQALDAMLKTQNNPKFSGVPIDKYMEMKQRLPGATDEEIMLLVRPAKPTRNGNGTPVPQRPESSSAGPRFTASSPVADELRKQIRAAGGDMKRATELAYKLALLENQQPE